MSETSLRRCVAYQGDIMESQKPIIVRQENIDIAKSYLAKRLPSKKATRELKAELYHQAILNTNQKKHLVQTYQQRLLKDTSAITKESTKIALHVRSFMRQNSIFCGRASNQNNSYCVQELQAGSFLANIYPVGKLYTLNESLSKFKHYFKQRLLCNNVKALMKSIEVPEKLEKYLNNDIIGKPCKAFDYLRLTGQDSLYGNNFRTHVMSLQGKQLGCFCASIDMCHVDIILEYIEVESKRKYLQDDKIANMLMNTPSEVLLNNKRSSVNGIPEIYDHKNKKKRI